MKIDKQIISFLSEKLGVDELEVIPEACLVWDLGCDTLDIAEILLDAESKFGFNFLEEDQKRFENIDLPAPTVKDLTDAIKRGLSI
jgi:acyl carrier protein